MFTDTHCHLTSEFYDDIENVLNNAKEHNIVRYISCGDNLENSKEVYKNSLKYDNYYCSLGIHPEHQFDSYIEFKNYFNSVYPNNKIVAIGEIGLDYHYDDCNKVAQIELFENQLKLAEDKKLPVIVHSREATLDTINSLKKYNVNGVIHCFSGSIETAREYIRMGYYIGVGGVVTFKNAKIKDVIKEIPLDRLLLETDSPFLAPTPYRGQKNEPAYVYEIAEFVAELKNISIDELSTITNNNIKSLFNI